MPYSDRTGPEGRSAILVVVEAEDGNILNKLIKLKDKISQKKMNLNI
jgi:hypothetical protein